MVMPPTHTFFALLEDVSVGKSIRSVLAGCALIACRQHEKVGVITTAGQPRNW